MTVFFLFYSHLQKMHKITVHYKPNIGPIKVNLEFSSSISVFTYFSAIADCQSLVFYKLQLLSGGFELFSQLIIVIWLSNLELGFSNLGFKTRVFNFQFLTQPDIPFSRFLNFNPEKGHFLAYFNRPINRHSLFCFILKIPSEIQPPLTL